MRCKKISGSERARSEAILRLGDVVGYKLSAERPLRMSRIGPISGTGLRVHRGGQSWFKYLDFLSLVAMLSHRITGRILGDSILRSPEMSTWMRLYHLRRVTKSKSHSNHFLSALCEEPTGRLCSLIRNSIRRAMLATISSFNLASTTLGPCAIKSFTTMTSWPGS
jgi:hypothetical protein